MTITSPHNEQLKEVRKLAGRKWRDKLREFVAEGEDLLAAADAAGWEPLARLRRRGLRAGGRARSRRTCSRTVSQLGSGTRALGVYGQRWAPAPVGPLCLALWGVNDPGNVGTVLRSALAFGAAQRGARARARADPYGAEGGARVDGRAVRRAGRRACATSASCPAARSRSSRAAGAAAAPRSTGDVTLVVGAEREGLPGDGRRRRATRSRTSRSARSR